MMSSWRLRGMEGLCKILAVGLGVVLLAFEEAPWILESW